MYRLCRRSLLALALLGALAVGFSDPVLSQGSVTYQVNAAHNGAIEFAEGFKLPLQQAWSRRLRHHVSYPVVADGRVFVTAGDRRRLTEGTDLFALDTATGSIIWSKPIPGSFYWSALAYDDGRLFVINYNSLLRALDPSTGNELWATQLSGDSSSTAPTARDGIVYAKVGQKLYAVNAFNGQVVWSSEHVHSGNSSPAISSDGVFISLPCHTYQFDKITGETRWHNDGPCDGGGSDTPILYSDRLFVRKLLPTEFYTIAVLNLIDGSLIEKIDGVSHTPAFRGGVAYIPGDRSLVARSVATGGTLWQIPTTRKPVIPPVVINGKVLIISAETTLSILDGTTGQTLQQITLPRKIGLSVPGASAGPLSGLGAGDGMLFVPAGPDLVAYKSAP
jgi:outer membrane protein assembly factor BamB